jgi:hypothetical protein
MPASRGKRRLTSFLMMRSSDSGPGPNMTINPSSISQYRWSAWCWYVNSITMVMHYSHADQRPEGASTRRITQERDMSHSQISQVRKCATGPITAITAKTSAARRSAGDQRAQSRAKLERIVMAASALSERAPDGRCHKVTIGCEICEIAAVHGFESRWLW